MRPLLLLLLPLAAAAAASSVPERFLEATGLRLEGASVGDLVCLARRFPTPASGWAGLDGEGEAACGRLGTASRWAAAAAGEAGLRGEAGQWASGPVRAMAWDARDGGARLLLFRHQEGETLLDADMWEAMALYGRPFVEMLLGGRLFGVDAAAALLQRAIFEARRAAGLAHLPHAELLARAAAREAPPGARLVLGGFSLGGAMAKLVALRLGDGTSAVGLGANGVRDAARLYGLGAARAPLFTLADAADMVPRMDCALGPVCVLPNARPACGGVALSGGVAWEPRGGELESEACPAHRNLVYGPWGLNALAARGNALLGQLCLEPAEWNRRNGVCQPQET